MIDLSTVSLLLLATAVTLSAQSRAAPKSKLSRVEELVIDLSSDDRWERAAARLVLLRSESAKPLAAAIKLAAEEKNSTVAKRVIAVLDRLGLDGSGATGALTTALDDLDDGLLGIGLDALTQITPARGRDSRQIQTIMTKIVGRWRRTPRDLRMQNLKANLRIFQGKTEIAPNASVPELIEGLRKHQLRSRDGYCQLLGQRGEAAKSALATLGRFPRNHIVTSREGEVGQPIEARFGRNVAVAILRIDPTSQEAAHAYGYLILAEPFRYLRLRAARELMASPYVSSAVPFLVEFLGRRTADAELTRAVINSLAIVGSKAVSAIPMLEKLTESADEKTAAKARSALKRIRAKREHG